jgi:Na+/pantothenate symporter
MRRRGSAAHFLALTTVFLLTWLGLTFLSVKPVVGGVLLSLAAFRLFSWIRLLIRRRQQAD